MSNPFDDPNGTYFVLVNSENQHSLWPDGIAIPAGWETVYGPEGRDSCMLYIEESWTDIAPRSVTQQR